jgi:hypothetical protein
MKEDDLTRLFEEVLYSAKQDNPLLTEDLEPLDLTGTPFSMQESGSTSGRILRRDPVDEFIGLYLRDSSSHYK